jgi:signal transduction histidine kinase
MPSEAAPRRAIGLFWQLFLSILAVALGAVLAVGLITRAVFSAAFDAYLQTLPAAGAGMGMRGQGTGRHMVLTATEQTFLASVDRGVLIGGVAAVLIAAVGALLLARYLTRPLDRLEAAAVQLAAGDLTHRVEPGGPHEVEALGQAFNRMADSLETAEDLRRRLVADVAHELRNPIAAARAQAEGMAEGVLPAEPARLDSLVDDIGHLSRLVDDLQELAVAEAGRLHYEMSDVDLAALVKREVDRAAPAAAPGVLVSVAGADAPLNVRGDEQRLSQVLRNLLSNAARHTSEGTIEVALSHTAQSVAVRVTDTGEGISPEDLPHVFERFYRADSARAAHTGGAGLGLAIARRLVEDHGGEVFAESVSGQSTTVGFTLPRAD